MRSLYWSATSNIIIDFIAIVNIHFKNANRLNTRSLPILEFLFPDGARFASVTVRDFDFQVVLGSSSERLHCVPLKPRDNDSVSIVSKLVIE